MRKLESLSENELKNLAKQDNKEALYETAIRFRARGNIKKARKYLILAAILGYAPAQSEFGKLLEEEDNYEDAYEMYNLAYNQGEEYMLTAILRLLLITDRQLAIEILKSNAIDGHSDCLKMLVEIYTNEGNDTEANYWKAKLDKKKAKKPKKIKKGKKTEDEIVFPNTSDEPHMSVMDVLDDGDDEADEIVESAQSQNEVEEINLENVAEVAINEEQVLDDVADVSIETEQEQDDLTDSLVDTVDLPELGIDQSVFDFDDDDDDDAMPITSVLPKN